jgi:hypothetical protein
VEDKIKSKVDEMTLIFSRQENDYKLKMGVLAKEKENLNR